MVSGQVGRVKWEQLPVGTRQSKFKSAIEYLLPRAMFSIRDIFITSFLPSFETLVSSSATQVNEILPWHVEDSPAVEMSIWLHHGTTHQQSVDNIVELKERFPWKAAGWNARKGICMCVTSLKEGQALEIVLNPQGGHLWSFFNPGVKMSQRLLIWVDP